MDEKAEGGEVKRSPLKRSTGEARTQTQIRRCKAPRCRNVAMPYKTFCGPECGAVIGMAAIAKAKLAADKKAREAKKIEAASDRERTEAMKTFPDLLKEVKAAMHEWVRLRDRAAGRGCISCGRNLQWGAIGGKVDAGHCRSVGSAAHLRFDERNVHAQCVYCNRDLGGNPHEYRRLLPARIGIDATEALMVDETPRNYTKDDLRELRTHYRSLANTLRRASGSL